MIEATRTVYMAVSADEYELPISINTNAAALAATFNLRAKDVYCDIANSRKIELSGKKNVVGSRRGFKFIKVILDKEDLEELEFDDEISTLYAM